VEVDKMKDKKILSVLIILCLLVSMLPNMAFAADGATWDGSAYAFNTADNAGDTEVNPFIIDTAGKLAYLAQQVNAGTSYEGKYFKLTANLNLSGHTWVPIGSYTWVYIGSSADNKPFKGIFDGNGKTISNLIISDTSKSYQGLFGFVLGDATTGVAATKGIIKNLTLTGVNLNVSYNSGGVVGTIDKGTIAGCGVDNGTITGSYSAGIAGRGSESTITQCYNKASVSGNQTGGIAAYGGFVSQCYNTGTITGTNAGGIAYSADIIKHCYNTGHIYGNDSGGISGNSNSVENCYNTALVSFGSGISNALSLGATIKNNVFLGQQNNALRIVYKSYGGTLQNNYAWEGLLYGGGVDRGNQNILIGLNGLDGQGIAKSQLTPQFWIDLGFTNLNGWTLPTGETGVPTLTNVGTATQTSTLPIHMNASVTIASQPTKLCYNNGDTLDLSGLKVNVVFMDGTTATNLPYNYTDFYNKGLFVAYPSTKVSVVGYNGNGLVVRINYTNVSATTSALTVAKTVVSEAAITFPTAAGINYGYDIYYATLSNVDAYIPSALIGHYAWNYTNIIPTVSNGGYQVKLVPDYYEGGNYDFSGLEGWDSATNTVVRTIPVAVTPAAINVTSVTPQNKTYDGTATATIGSATYVGKVGTDDVSITSGALAFNDKNVGTNKVVSIGAIFTLTGAAAGNYTLTGTPTVNTASIASKTITVTPNDNQGKIVGQSDPALTYSFSGKVGEETPKFTGVLTRETGETAASYAIQQGNLALTNDAASGFLASNYTLAFTTGKNFTISVAPVAPTITTTSLSSVTAGTPYSQTLAATGDAPITWSIDGESLPVGLSLSAGGVINGTPTTAGTFNFTVKATNATSSDTQNLSITVNAPTAPTYAVSATTNAVIANGLTATAAFGSSPYTAGATATVTITLSGSAIVAGTHTVGLTSTDAGTITAPAIVTKTATAEETITDAIVFTFIMPSNAVGDLAVTHTFVQEQSTAQSTAPTASAVTVVKTAATQASVNFTLASALTGTWKVYDAQTGGDIVSNVTASAIGITLSLTHVNDIPANTYYVSVTEEGKTESTRLALTVGEYVEPTYTYTMSASSLTAFASQIFGYITAPVAQTVTISNTGNQIIEVIEPVTTNSSSNYNIGTLSTTTLTVGGIATFTVQPKTGLTVETYTESINISGSNSAATSVSAQFSVSAANNVGSGSSSSPTPVKEEKVDVIFNKDAQKAATAKVEEKNNIKTTTVTLDDVAVKENLDKMDIADPNRNDNKVIIPVNNNSDVVVAELNGQTVKDMADKKAVLEIKTENVSYTLPAVDINIDDVSSQMGKQVELKDIKVSVRIAEASSATATIVADSAKKNSYTVVVKPIEFEITCTSGTKTVNVSKFNSYVERTVAMPDGIDPSKITTGVVLNSDGTFSHVPTTIVVIGGKYYAKISSLTNSTYTVIWNPIAFKDVEKHWAKDYVNDIGSRLIDSGVGNGNFAPNMAITRAEFASMIVKALGLKGTNFSDKFSDVKKSDSYYKDIYTADEYGIIAGYSNGKFGTQDLITRQQAMTMISKAMKISGMDGSITETDISSQLNLFKDSGDIYSSAKQAASICIKYGIFGGSKGKLTPKGNITRAESATIIVKLLKKSSLI